MRVEHTMSNSSFKIPVSRPSLTSAEVNAAMRVIAGGHITLGPEVRALEEELASRLSVEHVILTTSGTAALHLALVALNVGPGDEVLVPDITFVATANAVRYTGATPILVDVDPTTLCMDINDAKKKMSGNTVAAIPVHLYGYPCDVYRLTSLCAVIEDAAEGLGGEHHDGAALGTSGVMGCFSFYANKIITTGEGGAVVTASSGIAHRLRLLRGQAMDPDRRYFHTDIGFNYRMTDVQAAIGRVQLSRIQELLLARWRVFDQYRSNIGYLEAQATNTRQAPWQFVISVDERDYLASLLATAGIETRPVFVPMHRLPMYYQRDALFPVASRAADRDLCLPTFPHMREEEIKRVCDIVQAHDYEVKRAATG